MLRKGWEAIALLVAAMVIVNIVAAAVEPFLPILGVVVITLTAYIIIRFAIRRRF